MPSTNLTEVVSPSNHLVNSYPASMSKGLVDDISSPHTHLEIHRLRLYFDHPAGLFKSTINFEVVAKIEATGLAIQYLVR